MAIDIAYCLDTEEFLDPDRAYDRYWQGKIKDKRNFCCPFDGCDAQITCANLDVAIQDMKVHPHYKVYGHHVGEDCRTFNKLTDRVKYEDGKIVKTTKQDITKSVSDVFITKRPASYYQEKKIDDKDQTKPPRQKGVKYKSKGLKKLQQSGNTSSIYSTRAVVSRYIRYRADGSLSLRRLNIKGKDVPYTSIFKCIWEQDIEKLPEHPIIYYGWAFVNRLKNDNGYQIKFMKELKKGNNTLTTTVLIMDGLIDKYPIKKLVSTRLEKTHEKTKPTAFIFIYGHPKFQEGSNGKLYAKIDITNLDMIDINYKCPLPRQYNK